MSGSSPIENLYNHAANPGSPINALYGANSAAATKALANAAQVNPTGKAIDDPLWDQFNKPLPYPNAIPGSPQADANAKQQIANQNAYSGYEGNQSFMSAQGGWESQLAQMIGVATATAGIGGLIAPAISGAASSGAAAAGASAGTASTVGSVAGGVATGAAGGAAGGALTGGNIGKGALIGGVLGGIGGGLKSVSGGVTQNLTDSGVPAPVSSGIVNAGIGAVKGAIGGAISGQGAGAGAAGGALSAGTGAVAGSIFGSGDTVTPNTPSSNTNNMADDSYDFTNGGMYGPDLSGSTNVSDPYGAGNIDYTDPMAGMGGGNAPISGYLSPDQLGGVGNGSSGGGAAGSLLGQLAAHLLGNGSGGGMSPGLLSQLLGLGANVGGNILNSNAAKGAANTYAGETKFNPYSINGPNGSTSFNGNTATSTLSPQQAALQKMLQGLGTSSGNSLIAGPQAASQNYFNALQAQDRSGNNKAFQSNLDSQFANGVLGSTAGQYQSQAALGAIGQKTMADQVAAQNFGQQQQQQQLAQLTGSLNGLSGINSQSLQQMLAGFGGGSDASSANSRAYLPSLYANSNSTFGNALTGLGNAVSNPGYPHG